MEAYGLLSAPILGDWLAHKRCQAYHRGFVDPLAADPKAVILSLIHPDGAAEAPVRGRDPVRTG